MAPKRILIATPLYPPQVGGPATRVRLLEERLPADHGISVRTAKFGWVLWLPRGIRHLVYFFILYFMSFGTETILSLDAASVGWPASLVARIRKLPLVIIWVGDAAWERGVQQFDITDTLEQFALRTLDELPERVAILKQKQKEILFSGYKIIVPSNYLKTIAVRLGIPAEKISVIYNAFEPVEINESREELRKKFGWDKRVIMSAGRDVPWKGFAMLREVMKEIPDTELFIANTLGRHELLERIKAADLFVLNTGYEGFSHQLLEVMSVGTPIITTNVGGNPELITDGEEGLLVPFNDRIELAKAITILLQKTEYAAELARRAKEKVSQFSVERMISELVSLL